MKGIMPPTIWYLLIALAILTNIFIPIKNIIIAPYSYYIGIPIIIIGCYLDIWAWNIFRKNKTTLNPYKKARKFEISGPYRFSRNPMYLGMEIALIGLAALLGSIISFIYPIIFPIIINNFFIKIEEKNMKKRFGKKYLDYKNKVKRWI